MGCKHSEELCIFSLLILSLDLALGTLLLKYDWTFIFMSKPLETQPKTLSKNIVAITDFDIEE